MATLLCPAAMLTATEALLAAVADVVATLTPPTSRMAIAAWEDAAARTIACGTKLVSVAALMVALARVARTFFVSAGC